MKSNLINLVLLSLITTPLMGYELQHTIKKVDHLKQEITLTFLLKQDEYLYKDSLTTSVNSPFITISQPQASCEAVPFFDKTAKVQKEGYKGTVTFTIKALAKKEVPNALMHTHFLVSSTQQPQENLITISFGTHDGSSAPVSANAIPAPAVTAPGAVDCEPQQPSLIGSFIQKIISAVQTWIGFAKSALAALFSSTTSPFLRLLAALLLGILLSLTPCIYPMIPITVGILQASGSSSKLKNFLLALSYTIGISTTFAILGLIASLGSCVFGELQGSPFFIIPLSALLIYFALTMFDFVQFHVPSWLQPKASNVKGGSFLSAYLFGALSGTVASPCLSPGLVLILNYVTHQSASSIVGYIEGFALLFIFGVGSSLPLLIIGTFSGSLSVLPKAGQWMVEIKKIVGIMLIAMACYHLSHLERLLPWYMFAWVVAAIFFAIGVYYFVSIHSNDRKSMRWYKNSMGLLMIITCCVIAVQGYKAVYDYRYPSSAGSQWYNDYQKAFEAAQKEKKLLFIDIGASYCSACKILDERIFSKEIIKQALESYVALKVDSDIQVNSFEAIRARYASLIDGFPTYIIVNSHSGEVIKKWSVEIDDLSLDAVAEELKKLTQNA